MSETTSKPKTFLTIVIAIAKEISVKWGEKTTGLMAAAIAFYSMMSLAPLMVFLISIVGLFFTESAVKDQLLTSISEVLGPDTAVFVEDIIAAASYVDTSAPILAIIGGLIVIFFASTIFNSVKIAFNNIWDVNGEAAPRTGIVAYVWNRLLAAAMVLLTGGALFVMMLSTVVTAIVNEWLLEQWPEVAELTTFSGRWVGVFILIFMFTVAYKWLPDAPVLWRYALVGASFATILFLIGNKVIGIYFSLSSLPTIYGAAGSLVVLLLWVYYSSYIVLFGALFTRALTRQMVGETTS